MKQYLTLNTKLNMKINIKTKLRKLSLLLFIISILSPIEYALSAPDVSASADKELESILNSKDDSNPDGSFSEPELTDEELQQAAEMAADGFKGTKSDKTKEASSIDDEIPDLNNLPEVDAKDSKTASNEKVEAFKEDPSIEKGLAETSAKLESKDETYKEEPEDKSNESFEDEGMVIVEVMLEKKTASYLDAINIILLQRNEYDLYANEDERRDRVEELGIFDFEDIEDVANTAITRGALAALAIKANNLEKGFLTWATGWQFYAYRDALSMGLLPRNHARSHHISGRGLIASLDLAMKEGDKKKGDEPDPNVYKDFGYTSYEQMDADTPDYIEPSEQELLNQDKVNDTENSKLMSNRRNQ